MNLEIPDGGIIGDSMPGAGRSGKNIAVIYDRLNFLTLGSIITLAKDYVDKIYVIEGADPRPSSIARSLGAEVIGPSGLSHIHGGYSDGATVFLYGDGSHSPDKIPALLDEIANGYDLAVSAGACSDLNENVLYLNNRQLKSGFSGFMACSSACVEELFSDNMVQPKQAFGYALSKGLKVRQLDRAYEGAEKLSLYRIGVVVPAYNEEKLIGPTILTMPYYVSKIYVIDDCSTDHMSDVVNGINDPRVVYIRHEVNKGVGAAIITGYKKSLEDEMDVVAVMAGDNQMDPDQLPRLLMPVIEGKADYTKGNRLMSKSLRKGMSSWRSLGNQMLTMVTKIGSGYWHITDPQNGYTAISRQALESMDLDSVYTYYGYCNDLLIKLNAFGMKTTDIVMPARYGEEKSKIKYSRFILKVAPMIFRGFLWRLKTKYVVLDFNPLVLFYLAGMAMIPAGILFGAWTLFLAFSQNAASPTYLLMTILILVWGLQFLLFAMTLDARDNKSKDLTNKN